MRVLLTSQPGEGHWRPLAGLAVGLEAAGHHVAFVSTPATCRAIRNHGFGCFVAGVGDDGGVRRSGSAERGPADVDSASEVWRQIFAGRRVEEMLPGMLEVVRTWSPDLVVWEISEFGGMLAAEVLEIPHAALQISAWRPEIYQLAAVPIGLHRSAVGLPPDPDSSALYRYLLLSPEPPAYRDPDRPFPPTVLPVRLPIFDAGATTDVLPQLPANSRPRIYATLGTAYNQQPQLFKTIIDAVGDLDVDLVMATSVDPESLGLDLGRPNVTVRRYIPQHALLPDCDLVISHAGFGAVQAALRHGLPQVLLPIAADQPDNARHCAAHGVAEVVWPEGRNSEAIQSAVQAVLSDPGYRAGARRWQREIDALPGTSEAIKALSSLAEMFGAQ